MHISYDWNNDYNYGHSGRNNKMSDNKTGGKSANINAIIVEKVVIYFQTASFQSQAWELLHLEK